MYKFHRITLTSLLLASLTACGGGGGGGGTTFTPKVNAPLAGVFWSGTKSIRWTVLPEKPGTVQIRLSNDGGSSYGTQIVAAAQDDGALSWDTTSVVDGSAYRIRILSTDSDGQLQYSFVSDGPFTVDNTAPVLSLSAPLAGTVQGGMLPITWNTTDANPGTVQIRLSSDGGLSYPDVIAASAPDTGSFNWNTTGLADGAGYRLRLVAIDLAGNAGTPVTMAGSFTLDNTAPTVSLISPAGGEMWSGNQTIAWTSADAHPGTVELRLSSNGGVSFPEVIDLAAPDTGSYLWNTGLGPDGANLRVQVIAVDEAGNSSAPSASAGNFEITNMRILQPVEYRDANRDSLLNAGDVLIVRFDKNVTINGAGPSDFDLPVAGDSLGTGASVAISSNVDELIITLGTAPVLRAAGTFDDANLTSGAPSGIDVSAMLGPNVIESDPDGVDAVATEYFDIVPGFQRGFLFNNGAGKGGAMGDLDSDGDLDVVVAHNAGESNTVWFNNGVGNFSNSGQSLGASESEAVALGDLDGDGDLDLAVANGLSQANTIWLNDGAGSFTDSGQALGAADTRDLVLADLDGDGDLDIATGNGGDMPNRVFLNDGTGLFSGTGQALGSDGTLGIDVGDLDGDGDLDLLTGNGTDGSFNRFWRNDGSGSFTSGGNVLQTNTRDVALGDLDGDGDLDVFISMLGQNEVALNNGNGSFTQSGQFFSNNDHTNVKLADMDQDGDLDAVTGKYNDGNRVFLNDGTAFFTESTVTLGGNNTTEVLVEDIDLDGDLDILAINENESDVPWLASLSGSQLPLAFSDSGQSIGSQNTSDVALADLDSDGDLDALLGVRGAGNQVWLNDGTGTLVEFGAGIAAATGAVAVGDLDSDGDLDFVDGVVGAANKLYFGNGSGFFSLGPQGLGAFATEDVALADVDADGDLDLICANDSAEPNRVYLNNGSGTFMNSGQNLGSGNSRALAMGDVDGDGDLDLCVGNDAGANTVWTNDGSGTFSDSGQTLGAADTRDVLLVDLDRDSDLDLVTANEGSTNQVWLNNGAGIFSLGTGFDAGATQSIAVADVDRDGDLDVFSSTNGGSPALSLWLGDGAGGLLSSGMLLGAADTTALATGDLDRDGDVDLFEGTAGAAPDAIWMNQ